MVDFQAEVDRLSSLVESLKECKAAGERIAILNQQPQVKQMLQQSSLLRELCASLHEDYVLILQSLVVIGQWESLCEGESGFSPAIQQMLEELVVVERFYDVLGGIVGYHHILLSLLCQKLQPLIEKNHHYHPPLGVDISLEEVQVRRYLLEGIISLPLLSEIYPVGGAADRLRLLDPLSGEPLPAALLPFCGYTLLEGLIRDLQAREYLYYKLFHKQLVTPIAMMTSSEKNNHEHLIRLCKEVQWFGRGEESFRFFCQPKVPAMDPQGRWCSMGQGKLLMKPGGHGVLWKLAQDSGVLDWMQRLGRQKMLVRQINNPIAGIDYGLLAFYGVGFVKNKQFGFASCSRQVASAEGVNVLIEKKELNEIRYCLTNIEYCDFSKFSIQDVPTEPGGSYSRFPSNTNILFVDIDAAKRGIEHHPIPGMLVNSKSVLFTDERGSCQEKEIVRLESTMQNLADHFEKRVEVDQGVDSPLLDAVNLPTFLTHHKRHKTISAIKKMFQPEGSLLETPEGCFYDVLLNAHELLTQYCSISLPPMQTPEAYIHSGPSFLFFYHPALGPLFSIIAQKLRRGRLSLLSELTLEIAEVDIEGLDVSGVLQVRTSHIMGEIDAAGLLQYSESVGRCVLHSVVIQNEGIDLSRPNIYWKKEIAYKERCEIVIEGNGEFYAAGVTLSGSMCIVVKQGTRKTAFEEEGVLKFKEEPLPAVRERRSYRFTEDLTISLENVRS